MKIAKLKKVIGSKNVLTDIDFTLYENEIVGLIGRNGSGKTTLFRTIAGHYRPDEGSITINGQNIATETKLKTEIFYIDELDNFLKYYTLQSINDFYRTAYPTFNQDLYLQLMKEHGLNQRLQYRKMSKGMQGLYQMILAISSRAKYLLLDEPFDGLDIIVRKKVIGLLLTHLSEEKRCALIASHNLQELEGIIDRALLIKGQTIAKDYTLENMRANARKIQLVFRTKQLPPIVKENSKLITIQGRVIVAVFENYNSELATTIKSYDPLVFEELPLTLEDLFEANLQKEQLLV
ncbi:acetoin ABC transporter ATP-binding protein [Enterococcus saigonensis]|uniref:Acetoin ABC transporter ATP-binding protein n=1 Tax=Enterococcus saigonensis TaxID=1805431 RepID=A0A679IQC3_9ENTE|nr:ABC transporter ATP-binding protein [Enterococcus saigonensis]BCA86134.1 acetoin ABC transporter ATP-binding protein [Enterococcus saigonensis]